MYLHIYNLKKNTNNTILFKLITYKYSYIMEKQKNYLHIKEIVINCIHQDIKGWKRKFFDVDLTGTIARAPFNTFLVFGEKCVHRTNRSWL